MMNEKQKGDRHNQVTDGSSLPKEDFKELLQDQKNESNLPIHIEDVKPPDGGWGWFCVLGSFLSHIIIGGMERSGGVLYLELESRYGGSSSEIAWTHALRTAIRLLGGPISSALSQRFSCRTVVVAGGLIFTVSFLASAFSPSLYFLYFSYGALGGIGGSFAYAPSLIIVGLYFHKHRGLAVGIATAGVGIGTFLIPPLFEILLEYYGFTGAFILLAGLPLQLCICGMLFRPLTTHLRQPKKNSSSECEVGLLHEEPCGIISPSRETNKQNRDISEEEGSGSPSNLANSRESCDKKQFPENSEKIYTVKLKENSRHLEYDQPLHIKSQCVSVVHNTVSEMEQSPLNSHQADEIRNFDGRKKRNMCLTLLTKINNYFEFSLLKNIRFLLFCIAILHFTIAFMTVYIYIPPLAKSRNISEIDAAYLISIAGICDCCGRFILSVFFDSKRIRPFRELCYVVVCLLGGIVMFVIPTMTSYVSIAILTGLFGFLTGGYISQKSIVIVDIFGPEKLASSFGIVLLFQGVGTLLGPPLAGVLADTFGTYDETFYLCGTVMVLGGLIFMVGDLIKRYQKDNIRSPVETEVVGVD